MSAEDITAYNNQQSQDNKDICDYLRNAIDEELTEAEPKVWHGGPVWFIKGNPVVGYWVRKRGVQLLFWSGQSFDEQNLKPEGKFMAAEINYLMVSDIDRDEVNQWLKKARDIQWDYKNIVKNKGKLDRLK